MDQCEHGWGPIEGAGKCPFCTISQLTAERDAALERIEELELAVRADESAQAVLVQRVESLEHDLAAHENGLANAH
jgi:hypothetical protein